MAGIGRSVAEVLEWLSSNEKIAGLTPGLFRTPVTVAYDRVSSLNFSTEANTTRISLSNESLFFDHVTSNLDVWDIFV